MSKIALPTVQAAAVKPGDVIIHIGVRCRVVATTPTYSAGDWKMVTLVLQEQGPSQYPRPTDFRAEREMTLVDRA